MKNSHTPIDEICAKTLCNISTMIIVVTVCNIIVVTVCNISTMIIDHSSNVVGCEINYLMI